MPSAPPSSAEFAAAVMRMTAVRGPVVVKLGGSAMEDPTATDACLRSVATLHLLRIPIVLVHGGGKPIDRAMADAGLIPKKVAGRRYTDEATLRVVVDVLRTLNHDLARQLTGLGVDAVGAIDADYYTLHGQLLKLSGPDGASIDLGWVGTVARVNSELLDLQFFEQRRLAVIPSLAEFPESPMGWLNVNADTAASAVAGALKAEKAIFLTDTPGVLRDRHEPASLIPRLTEAECRGLIASGVIDGGMVPKVEACFEALAAGARSALILDGRVPYSLLDVFLRDTFTGTEITR